MEAKFTPGPWDVLESVYHELSVMAEVTVDGERLDSSLNISGGAHSLLGLQIGVVACAFAALSGWGLFRWIDARAKARKRTGFVCFLIGLFGGGGALLWGFAQFL